MRRSIWVGLAVMCAVAGCGGRVIDSGGSGIPDTDPPNNGAPSGSGGNTSAVPPGSTNPATPGTSIPGAGSSPTAPSGTAVPSSPDDPNGSAGPVVSAYVGMASNYVLGGVTNEGQLVAAFWTGTAEAVVLLDPSTARQTFLGYLGSLYKWNNQLTYDASTRIAYALGYDRHGVGNVYSLSLDGIMPTSVTILATGSKPVDYVIGGVTSDRKLVMAYWDGAAERAGLLDPTTGEATQLATFGALQSWQGQLAYDRARGKVYASGNDVGYVTHLYKLDLATGQSATMTYSTSEVDGVTRLYVLGGVGARGNIVAAYWTGAAESVVLMNADGQEIMPLGSLGPLTSWQGQIVVDTNKSRLYALAQDPDGNTRIYSLPIADILR